ncbi:MAG: ABC transporter ATP-binding protein, partial [Candidatus Hydrogenedentes bacterium]|nr:ABC transporter ATP-binding protein [Candidatus Hydrogenedentota bacterium]
QEGSIRVFGFDPVQHPVEVLSRIGYLSEDRDLPGWMRVRELMRYTQAFYPTWDEGYANSLRERFALDPEARIKHLSRGEKAKAGLLMALAYRPELLLLDEPSAGLDPAARRHILEAIVRTVADEGRTVIFSSHLLDEVERVSDTIAMIHQGKLVFQGKLDDIKADHCRMVLRFTQPQERLPRIDGVLHSEGEGKEWIVLCNGKREQIRQQATTAGAVIVEEGEPSLEEIFLARVGSAATGAMP